MSYEVIDSHVHLWPAGAANPSSHAWMQAGGHLTRQFSIKDYLDAVSSSTLAVIGFIFVETDRTIGNGDDIRSSAAESLEELKFLRQILEETLTGSDHSEWSNGHLMMGVIAWAPLDKGVEVFQDYLEVAKRAAGEALWEKVKGFRFLLQGIKEQSKFQHLVEDLDLIEILRSFRRQWAFDLGVDQRQGGVWQLELVADLLEVVHNGLDVEEKVTFILNHLCKPNMERLPTTDQQIQDFERWKASMERFSSFDNVYVKLSGAFSEIGDQDSNNPWPIVEIVQGMKPWLDQIFRCFTPQRIMFGSDWPVCNVRGPGDAASWTHWSAVVAEILRAYGCSSQESDRIWYGTAVEAYRLEFDQP